MLTFPSKETTNLYTLTLDEVMHIRRVVSKAELLDIQLKDMTLFWEVWKKEVCVSVCVCACVCVYYLFL